MNSGGYEIERKFLIRYPDMAWLSGRASASEIVQTYLKTGKGGTERVRKRSDGDGSVYTHTVKTHISNIRRLENEREITEGEYHELLRAADPERRTIEKTRLCLDYRGQVLEIDLYPFWKDRAVMEIELTDEGQAVELPAEIEMIREITDDRRYTNSSIARSVPEEQID